MDTTPIYDLRERLRAASIAGTNLLAEDFRLKRAYEAFKPMEAASPVFAKVGQLTAQLLSPDCRNLQGALLDAVTLTDAVICTLGAVDTNGEVEPVRDIGNMECTVVNAPYSTLRELLEALTTSGSGHYGYVCEVHDNHPDLFQDYRVKYTLVQALGASYAELAEKVEEWIQEENDKSILPLLYKDFDPKGKKEMVRRVRLISALAGAEANEFYIKMLAEAQKDVRTELIGALRHEPQNLPLLFDLAKAEKGRSKDKVFELLADISDEAVNEFYRAIAKKKPETVLKYLKNATTDWSADLVAELCDALLEKLETAGSASDKEKQELADRLREVVRAVFGKGGTAICGCCRKLLAQKDRINKLFKETLQKSKDTYYYTSDIMYYSGSVPILTGLKNTVQDVETALGKILHHTLIVNPDEQLQAFLSELYENAGSKKTNAKFLTAAAAVKLINDEDCVAWLEEQVTEKTLTGEKVSKERMLAVAEAVTYIQWNEKKDSYEFAGAYTDELSAERRTVARPISLSHASGILEWLKSHSSKEIDRVMAGWVPDKDEDMRRSMGAYFYNKALTTADNRMYLWNLNRWGWSECDGLAVQYVRSNKKISQWQLYNYLAEMPGDTQAKRAEALKLKELMRTGEVNPGALNILCLDAWLDKNL
ncbi:MAG: hypothetical protein K2P63_05395 [Lachnospiraceae bacterium]|nr:hypothetical protein [Lachnospiraceae bacterium]